MPRALSRQRVADIADYLLFNLYRRHTGNRYFRALVVNPLTAVLGLLRGRRPLLRKDVTRGKSFTRLKQLLPASFFSGGTFLDIGANDGFTESESYGFRAMGFRCLFVEPNPELLKILARAASAGDLIFPHALDTARYRYRLFRHKDDLLQSEVRILPAGVAERPVDFYPIGGEMETRTVDDLLDFMRENGFSEPGIVKIDIESVELESAILGKLMDLGVLPEMFIVESGDRDAQLRERLAEAGYRRILECGYNRYYQRQHR